MKQTLDQVQTVQDIDEVQKASFLNLMGKSSLLRTVAEVGHRSDKNITGLMADVNEKLFNPDSDISRKVPTELSVHQQFLEHMASSKEYRELKEITKNNSFTSALATAQLVQQIQGSDIDTTQPSEDMRDAIRDGLKAVVRVVSQTEQDIAAFTKALGDYNGRLSGAEAKFKLAEVIGRSQKMKNVARLLGRLKAIAAQKQKQKVKHGMDELVGVKIGSEIDRLVPSELAMLSDPDLEDIFMVNYIEDALVQYEMVGVESLGKGPIVVMVDNSGSMAGQREEWSKAIVFTLAAIAAKEKRTLGVIYYDSRVCPSFPRVYPKGKIETDEMVKLVEYFSGGGTDFVDPLRSAMKIVNEDKQFQKADLVMITDGACDVNGQFETEFSEWKKSTKSDMYTIAMASRIEYNTPIFRMSDQTFNYLDIIADDEHVGRHVENAVLSI